ncbi:MAG TPA: ABC transporter permease [Caulobacteraceae bacterium]|jgi:ABC-2 type transport system permease protein|nr:ABC transporter permease [Caulobacteraceae bacterium]
MNVMSKASQAAVAPPQPRNYASVNWTGLWTLYAREVRRFMKVWTQTLAAPVITALLYMMIFVVAVGGNRVIVIDGVRIPFGEFVGPGLAMMSILNNAFANASSSLIQAKIMGTAPDFLTPPLSPLELTLGFGLGAATRGVVVGLVAVAAVWPFSHFSHLAFGNLWAIVFFSLGASMVMGFIGVLTGLWSEKFDQLAAVTNFLVMPMTFLSGTFYTIDRLPPFFREVSRFNPFFYLIDGFRYGFIGQHEGSVVVGMSITVVLTLVLGLACFEAFRRGWRLKT